MSETATAPAPDSQSSASTITISSDSSQSTLSLTPATLVCQASDKICWVNNATSTVTITVPSGVSPNNNITLAAGTTSSNVTVNNGANGSSAYSATMGLLTASGSISVETSVTISIPATSAPATLNCTAGTKVTWTNNSGYSATLTLPSCVSPQNGPIALAVGASTQSYNTNNGNGTFTYSVSVANGEQDTRTGTIDING